MASSSAWGIDLGNRALKAVKLVRSGGGFQIEDFVVIEHEQILSVAGDNKESIQKTALAQFMERHATRGSVVGVGVSGQSSFARFIKLPPVEPKKIPEIIRFEAIQQIPFPLDDVEWAYQLFHEKDSPDVEVGIFAMRKELVNHRIGLFTGLGLNVQVVQMNPLAIYNGMYYDDQIGQTAIFMDAGAENTDLVICDGQTVWLRTLPIGGNSFTETLAKAFKLNFAKAEELKRTAASSKYAKQIFQAMRPVFTDLVSEIQRSIGFYASVHREARIQRIVALGSTFQLPGLQKYLQQNLQLPVEKLDAFKSTPPADPKLATNLSENVGTLAGAYGLALQALGEAKIASSLLPEKIRRLKMWQEKRKWFAAAAATFVLAGAGVTARYSYESYMYERAESARQGNHTTLATGQKLSRDWISNVQNQGDNDRKQIASIRALLDYRTLWPELVSDILATLPNTSVAELKKVPRTQRNLILLNAFRAQYWANMKDPLAAAPGAAFAAYAGRETAAAVVAPLMGMGGDMAFNPDMAAYAQPTMPMMPDMASMDPNAVGGASGTAIAGGPRGFLLTIRGVTPRHRQAADNYVDQALIQRLLKMTEGEQAKKNKPYFIKRAEMTFSAPRALTQPGPNGVPIVIHTNESTDADELAPNEVGANNAMSVAPSASVIDPRTGQPRFNPAADRIFEGETIENDTLFTILVAVVLDPKPSEKTEGK
jgi:type IV pilus assembly protein PilM